MLVEGELQMSDLAFAMVGLRQAYSHFLCPSLAKRLFIWGNIQGWCILVSCAACWAKDPITTFLVHG